MAYNQFNLDLQTGAFLQLILVLTAVASRLHILLEELGSAIDECKHTCVQLLGVLDPTHVPSNVSSVAQTPTEVLAGMSILPSPLIGDDEEDVGQSTPAVRRSEILSETQVDQLQVAASRGDKEPEVESLDFMFSTNTNSSASMPIAHSTVVHTTITAHEEQDNPTTKRRREERSTRVTKKKRKKDEIDNIFGF
ncbi:hypothetical protein NM688_g6699 [Phlebia brevispora]|uniref:Uncharacterized protein n=1 Tax=Phlebia brevispora TaxID=194682 RepID=A0ACC1SDJ0_9APHY|nr:hypothetical protein NM688_g6699 [Phlebia brevispora]